MISYHQAITGAKSGLRDGMTSSPSLLVHSKIYGEWWLLIFHLKNIIRIDCGINENVKCVCADERAIGWGRTRTPRATGQLKEVTARQSAKVAALKEAMAHGWACLLTGPAAAAEKSLRTQEQALQSQIVRAEVLRDLQANSASECPACMQRITPEARLRTR